MTDKDENYYQILEISINATDEEIREAYIRAKNAYSNNEGAALYSLMSQDECTRIIDKIEEAYTILSDTSKRERYNAARGLTAGVQEPKLSQKEEQELEEKQQKQASMDKIIAQKKFALEYEVNQEFEQEIESTEVFTGEFLKKIREYKNVDIVRMSELTKVSKTYLKNIEEENTSALPAHVYTRGFVFQYAKSLKLNPDFVATSYINHLKSKD